jgi:hypothetical protein
MWPLAYPFLLTSIILIDFILSATHWVVTSGCTASAAYTADAVIKETSKKTDTNLTILIERFIKNLLFYLIMEIECFSFVPHCGTTKKKIIIIIK